MLEFMMLSENSPFAIALIIMLMLSVIEVVGLMFGAGISGVLDNLLPDMDFEIEGPEMQAPGVLARIYGWFRVGEIPILVLLVVFLFLFGIIGISVQAFLYSSFTFLLPLSFGWLIILLVSLPFTRILGKIVALILPADETTAISIEELVGRIAVITIGTSKRGNPAEARVKDEHGQNHYVMVEPEEDDMSFEQTNEVLVVRVENGIFYCIAKPLDI